VLHVGDSHANDIVPAAMLGLPTVLIDRSTPRAAEAGAVGGGNSRTPAVTHDDNPGHETDETDETEETDRPSRSAPLATIRQLTELAHLLSR
jgi:FMN phosphatase YigB (HAD superfamily)